MHFVLKIEKVETFVMVVAFRKAGWGRKVQGCRGEEI